jgi:L-asparaginase II
MSGKTINPILATAYRGGVAESFHRGVVCIVDTQGHVVYSCGDIHQICYPRSAMKLLQVIPLLEAGGVQKLNLTLAEIAVMCGSHNGEAEHIQEVNSILAKCGLHKDSLQCGPQYPSAKKDANELIKHNQKPHHEHNNCSGKHAGMLATCVLMGWSTHDYLDASHPLQQAIMKVCSDFYEYPESQMVLAYDGCTAPIYSVPVYNQAVAYKNLAQPQPKYSQSCKVIVDAVSAHPFMVAGSGRYCTDMMKITAPLVIGKTGAEGVFCMSFTQQKLGVCIKIDDGKMQPQYNVAQAIIHASAMWSEDELKELHHYMVNPIINFNKIQTGELAVDKELINSLSQAFATLM